MLILKSEQMSANTYKAQEKQFVLKAYPSLEQAEKVIVSMDQKDTIPLQLSILGRPTINTAITKKELDLSLILIKRQLDVAFNKDIPFGYFQNPKIGTLFIAGHLTSTFLNKLNHTVLASLPSGLYGIFKSLGVKVIHINSYFTQLKKGNFLLIIRGERGSLAMIKPLLRF